MNISLKSFIFFLTFLLSIQVAFAERKEIITKTLDKIEAQLIGEAEAAIEDLRTKIAQEYEILPEVEKKGLPALRRKYQKRNRLQDFPAPPVFQNEKSTHP
jgi:uncharacterized membrane protein